MDIKTTYSTTVGVALGVAGILINEARKLPDACNSLTSTYNTCYNTALQRLGGGAEVFDVTSWFRGGVNSWKAIEMCRSQQQAANDCMDTTPYIVTALACTGIAIYAAIKRVRS